MVTCPECGKTFREEIGLRLHLSNPNRPHAGMRQDAIEQAVKKASLENKPQAKLQHGLADTGEMIAAGRRIEQQTRQLEDIRHTIEELRERMGNCEKSIESLTKSLQDIYMVRSRVDKLERRTNTLEDFHKVELLVRQIKRITAATTAAGQSSFLKTRYG